MFNDGGPAFPHSGGEIETRDPIGIRCFEHVRPSVGASLWDFYAAAALNALIGSETHSKAIVKESIARQDSRSVADANTVAAEMAGVIADAMISEREKRRANLAST